MPGIDPSSLSKKDKDELIELIESQSARITELEKKVKRGQTESDVDGEVNKGASQVKSAFDFNVLNSVKSQFNAFADTVKSLNPFDSSVLKEIDEYATQVQKSFGLGKDRLFEFKQLIGESSAELAKLGMSEQETVEVITDAMDGLNSAASLNAQTIVDLGATSQVTLVDVESLAEGFRGVGISMTQVGKEMSDVVDYARSVGSSVQAVSKGVIQNIEKLNLYNFDNGVKGLAKMASTAEKMGISLQDTFRIAEDLFSPEKAINLAAGLQRLGVSANGLLDPLRAMDMAQNDPEALQKEIVNLSKEFTTFNDKTGKMEILPGAKRRLREVAGELGISAGEFAKMSIQAADFDRKLKQIRMPALAEGDEETKELIASMAQLDASGVAKIQVKNVETGFVEEKAVEELTPGDIENLKKANEESSKSIEEIAINQLDETKQINALLKSGEVAAKFGKAITPAYDRFGQVVSNATKSVAARYREELGTTRGIAEQYNKFGQSLEDVTVGTLEGDEAKVRAGAELFAKSAAETFANIFESSGDFATNVIKDILSNVKNTYGSGNKSNEPQTVNLNVKLESDANTSKVDGDQVTKALVNSMQNPNTSNTILGVLNGGSAPSAVTGGKNTP